MSERQKPSIKFVNLHHHSDIGSPFDALGHPEEHMRYCWENGLDAFCLTDHGNMNGFTYQLEAYEKLKKEGKYLRQVYGAELYFIDSIEEWKVEYEKYKADKKEKKNNKDEEHSAISLEDEEDLRRYHKNKINRRGHLTTLVKNQTGLNNLFQLVSLSYRGDNFYRYPRVDYENLKTYSEGLITTSGCIGGFLSQVIWQNKEKTHSELYELMRTPIEKMLSIFGNEHFFGELQWNNIPEQHRLNTLVIELSKEYGFKVISCVDAHYPRPDAWRDRELYKRLGWLGKSNREKPSWLSDEIPENLEEIGYTLYPKNGDQMWSDYKKYSKMCGYSYDDDFIKETLKRTHDIAFDLVEEFEPDNKVRLPNFVVPNGEDENGYLAKLAIEGLKKKGLNKKKDYVERLKEELYIIKDRGFSKYFVTMKAIVEEARKICLIGPARGSGAGTLLAYVLDITQIDPIKYNLQFSRFLRRDAVDFPDLDVDFSEPVKLKEHLIREWGENSVVLISNFNTLQLKSLIKDVSKYYDIPFGEVNYVTSKMDGEAIPLAKKEHDQSAGVYVPTFEEYCRYSKTLRGFFEQYPEVKKRVEALQGQVRSHGVHAGGTCIGEDLNKWMPLINNGGKCVSPWTEGQTVRHLEKRGILKFDLLGLKTLRIIEQCIRMILKRNYNNLNPQIKDVWKYYNENLHPDKLNLNNKNVWENAFHSGNWVAVFQFTEKNAQNFCKIVKPYSINELSDITSIQRPGPLQANVDKLYLNTKENPETIEYIHPELKNILDSTYGHLLYQEQLSEIAHKLGKDISLDDGQTLRKVLTKKGTGKEEEVKNRLYQKFIDGCLDKKIKLSDAEELWQKMIFFSKYSFNKSHSISYSMISYTCAYLLYHYSSEWSSAYLDAESEDKKEKAINLVKSLGFTISPCDINKSTANWEIDPNDDKMLVQPFTSIKGLGDKAMEQIINNRPFNTIEELLFNENISYQKLNKKSLDVLVKSESLKSIMDNRFEHTKHMWCSVVFNRPKTEKQLLENIEEYRGQPDFSEEQKIEHATTLSGIFPFDMVMSEKLLRRLEEMYIPPISEYDPELCDCVWAIPRNVIQKKTGKGKDYYVVDLIDSNSKQTSIRCWGIDINKDTIYVNRPYMIKPDYSDQWGFSCRGAIKRTWKLLG